MSSYDDPRWYEQQPGENDTGASPSQQPSYKETDPLPHPQVPDDGIVSPLNSYQYPFSPAPFQPPSPQRSQSWRKFGQIVLLLAMLSIAYVGGWLSNSAYSNSFNPSNTSQSYENLFQQAWNAVDQHYVDRKAVDYKQMSYKAIQAMLDVLNDKGHTRFLTADEVQSENQQLSGTFTGIGIYLSQDPKTKQLIITSTIPGAPAEKAGFKHGDIIMAVNGVSTMGKDIAGVSSLIHGKAGTSVTLTILRPSTNRTLTITVTRAEIRAPNVLMHYIAEDHVAHIQIVQFAAGVSDQLKEALLQAEKLGAKKLILDLRENPGGYLNEAINTASEFIAHGNVLLEQDSSGNRTPYPVTGSTVDTTIPMAVLVNGDSASAAEIVTGALEDNKRAIVIGEKTFGTGTVLEEFPLSDGSAILLGTQEWLTPNGQFIRDQGIQPNISVQMGKNATPLTPNDENADKLSERQILKSGDTQLIAAINYLEKH